MLPQAEDAELLSEAVTGDCSALCELNRRYVDFVFATALRQTGDRHAAEDVTQTVFLIFAKKVSSIRPHALASWLHQTTRYTAANLRRSVRRRREHEHAAGRPEAFMPYTLPEPDPLLPLLDDAIGSLRAKDQRVIIERYLRGRDLQTVAAMLGATPVATQKRLERAIVKLRRAFARLGHRDAALTGAAIAATLSAIATSTAHAAPPGLAHAVTAHISPAAMSAKGWIAMLTGTHAKIAAAVLIGTFTLGAGVVKMVRVADAQNNNPAPAAATRTNASSVMSDADFPFMLDIKPTQAQFAAGDSITVTGIRGTGPDLRGGIVRITGTYTFASQDRATLAASVTAADHADAHGWWNDAQTMKIAKGRGTFKLFLPINTGGAPHVSFYGSSSDFGGVYLVDPASIQTSASEARWSVENAYPKRAPFTGIRWAGETAEVRVDGIWYAWLALDGRSLAELVADAKRLDDQSWQKRINEDLVELCAHAGHPVGDQVVLDLRLLNGGEIQHKSLQMTEENRQAVYTFVHSAPAAAR